MGGFKDSQKRIDAVSQLICTGCGIAVPLQLFYPAFLFGVGDFNGIIEMFFDQCNDFIYQWAKIV